MQDQGSRPAALMGEGQFGEVKKVGQGGVVRWQLGYQSPTLDIGMP